MTERELLVGVLEELNLPRGRWVLSGSGVMVLHGIERRMRDVDVFCATQTWFSLLRGRGPGLWEVFATDPDDPKRRCDPPYLYRTINGIEVNVFSGWRRRGIGDIDVAFWLHNAETVAGWPCVPLRFLLDWKMEVGRDKDQRDIRLIREHLGLTA